MVGNVNMPAGFGLRALSSVGSTNDEAKTLAGQGISDGTVVWAIEQTIGRGRQGRDWTSPPGNLYASVVLRDVGDLFRAAQLSFVAAIAMGEGFKVELKFQPLFHGVIVAGNIAL